LNGNEYHCWTQHKGRIPEQLVHKIAIVHKNTHDSIHENMTLIVHTERAVPSAAL